MSTYVAILILSYFSIEGNKKKIKSVYWKQKLSGSHSIIFTCIDVTLDQFFYHALTCGWNANPKAITVLGDNSASEKAILHGT